MDPLDGQDLVLFFFVSLAPYTQRLCRDDAGCVDTD